MFFLESVVRVTNQLYSKLLTSRDVRHGFTTRNLGDVSRSLEPWEQASGLSAKSLALLHQVHGCDILNITARVSELASEQDRCYDASMTDRDDVILGVRTADCVPILLCSIENKVVAAVHAGWRGTLAGVLSKTIRSIWKTYACKSQDLIAVMGPSIRKCCYEVNRELFDQFRQRLGAGSISTAADRYYLDLIEANRMRLLECGIREENIEVLDYCTRCRDDLFFSYRQEKDRAGRQLSYIFLGR